MVDAKPCPFCGAGSGAQHRVSSRRNEESWACSSCGARGPSVERDGSDGPLIEAWNARASIAAAITDRKFVEAADELRSIAEAEGWDWNAPKDAPNRYEKELDAFDTARAALDALPASEATKPAPDAPKPAPLPLTTPCPSCGHPASYHSMFGHMCGWGGTKPTCSCRVKVTAIQNSKPAPSPQPEREALGEPSERIAKFLDALEKRLDVDDDDAWMLSRSDIDYLRACLAHRAPATSSSATDSTERGWLIERNDKPSPLWWCGHSSRGMEWTPNSLEAIRFARKVDADMVNVTMLASCGVTTEHYWVAPWSPGRNVQNETAPAPSPALAAIVEAGDAMRNYFDETTLTMNRVKDKDAPGLMWALTEEYVSGATPILTDWDRARAALPKDGA